MTIIAPAYGDLTDPTWAQEITAAVNALLASVTALSGTVDTIDGRVTTLEDVVICQLVQTAAQTLTNNSATAMTFTTEGVDTAGGHDNSINNSRYTAQVAGWYWLSGGIGWTGNATGERGAIWRVSGVFVPGGQVTYEPEAAGSINIPALTKLVHLAVGDYVELVGFQSSGGNLNTNVDGGNPQVNTSMNIVLVRRD